MGRHARAFVIYGSLFNRIEWAWSRTPLDADGPDFAALWSACGLDAGEMDDAAEGEGRFLARAADALGLTHQHVCVEADGRSVLGALVAADGDDCDPARLRVDGAAEARVRAVAEALGLPAPRWHLVGCVE